MIRPQHPNTDVIMIPPQVLRDNRPTLMTCAETFLHDPLVDWTSSSSSSKSASRSGADDGENPQVRAALYAAWCF